MITIDFNKTAGIVKPMHAVNNGPIYKVGEGQRITNMETYKAAGIPYARNHDASFLSTYGGNHTVDVNFIFPDFDADPYDPASYDFACTDQYVYVTSLSGAETFYRLGSRIEHEIKKYNTLPPKDFKKWAVICEHIIRHYNYGWADGFYYNLQYWEIWNEADMGAAVGTTWGGTEEQFFELFEIAAKHLKSCFPELKIGGPAMSYPVCEWTTWGIRFLDYMKAHEVPMDFFSWHIYGREPKEILRLSNCMQDALNEHGYPDVENILNEWNYVIAWEGEDFVNSLRAVGSLVGASFTAAMMCTMQYSTVDMLMYYDARGNNGFNGMFSPYLYEPLKGYYPFPMFHKLYQLGTALAVENADETDTVYVCAGRSADGKGALMVTYYEVKMEEPVRAQDLKKQVKVDLKNLVQNGDAGRTVKFYLLDETHDMELVREETVCAEHAAFYLDMPVYSTYLITIE